MKITWRWPHSGSFTDNDGSLTGTADQTVIPQSPLYDPAHCNDAGLEFSGNGITGAVCDSGIQFGRMAWNHPHPISLTYADVIITTPSGTQNLAWRKKDITHKPGWNGLFPLATIINIEWQNFTEMTNISYDLGAWNLGVAGQHMLIQHSFNQIPDQVAVIGEEPRFINQSDAAIPDGTSPNGAWHFDNITMLFTYVLSANDAGMFTTVCLI
jgi:hypothetical protein